MRHREIGDKRLLASLSYAPVAAAADGRNPTNFIARFLTAKAVTNEEKQTCVIAIRVHDAVFVLLEPRVGRVKNSRWWCNDSPEVGSNLAPERNLLHLALANI